MGIGDITEKVNTGKGTDLGEGRLENVISLSISFITTLTENCLASEEYSSIRTRK